MIPDIKKRSLHRSKIINGQLKGLQQMIEQEVYCVDILTQGLAIQKSIASLNKLVLENHLRTHLRDTLSGTADKPARDKAIAELLDLYELRNVRGR